MVKSVDDERQTWFPLTLSPEGRGDISVRLLLNFQARDSEDCQQR